MTHGSRFAGTPLAQIPRRLLAFSTWLLEPERLPSVRLEASYHRAGHAVLSWLAARDALASRVADSSGPKLGFLSWLVSRDHLPDAVEVPRRQRGALSWLAASEPVPTSSLHKPTPPRSFLRWLLTSEPQQVLSDPDSPEEVQLHEP